MAEKYLKKSRRATILISVGSSDEIFDPHAQWKRKKSVIEDFFRSKNICCDFLWVFSRPSLPWKVVTKRFGKFSQVSEKYIITPLNARTNPYLLSPSQILINFTEGINSTTEMIASRSNAPIKVCITDKPSGDAERLNKYNMMLQSSDFETKGFDAYFPVLTMLLQSLD